MTTTPPRFGPNCLHYNGGCELGITIVRDEHLRIPCVAVRGQRGAVSCDEIELPPPAPEPELGQMSKMLESVLAGECPTCGVHVTGEFELGDGTYAAPCQHLLRKIPKPEEHVYRPRPVVTEAEAKPATKGGKRHLKLVE